MTRRGDRPFNEHGFLSIAGWARPALPDLPERYSKEKNRLSVPSSKGGSRGIEGNRRRWAQCRSINAPFVGWVKERQRRTHRNNAAQTLRVAAPFPVDPPRLIHPARSGTGLPIEGHWRWGSLFGFGIFSNVEACIPPTSLHQGRSFLSPFFRECRKTRTSPSPLRETTFTTASSKGGSKGNQPPITNNNNKGA